MADGTISARRSDSPRQASSLGIPSDRAWQGVAWTAIGLGTAAVVAGLGGRKSALAFTATALAGAVALEQMRGRPHGRGREDGKGRGSHAGRSEVERSITVGRTADELHERWRDPKTVPLIFAGLASVRALGDGRLHWTIERSIGPGAEWDSETSYDRPGDGIGWRSVPGSAIPNEGSIRFRAAPVNRGTVATLRFSFDPPSGLLGAAATGLLQGWPLELAIDAALRRFKSLVEAGEIPTTERQPAARADTR